MEQISKNKKDFCGYIRRFTITHVVTYLIFGITFMLVSNYFDYFAANDNFKVIMRPEDSIFVRIAPLVQFLRGALIGIALYPFREVIMNSKKGWLKLFGVLWILTSIGAVITGPGSIEGLLYTKFGFTNLLIGWPEVTLQILTFSYLFYRWEKKAIKKVETVVENQKL